MLGFRKVVAVDGWASAYGAESGAQLMVGFVDPQGFPRREPLAEVGAVPFEVMLPVRAFPIYRGQRNNTGLWWSSTVGGHVGFESWLERDLTLLDFDPQVASRSCGCVGTRTGDGDRTCPISSFGEVTAAAW